MKELTVDLDSFHIPIEKQVRVRDILIDIPVKYKCEAINTVFTISTKEAVNFIKSSKLIPLKISPGRSMLCITILNFYSTPVGPFTELTFSIIVGYNNKFSIPFISIPINMIFKNFGFLPISIAQSTHIAIEHGNIVTGYPHYSELTKTEFKNQDKFIRVEAYCEKEFILRLEIQRPMREKIKYESLTTYSFKDNKISRIKLETYGIVGNCKIRNFKLGSQERAELLKRLKISHSPIYTRYYRDTLKIIGSPIYLDTL